MEYICPTCKTEIWIADDELPIENPSCKNCNVVMKKNVGEEKFVEECKEGLRNIAEGKTVSFEEFKENVRS